MHRAVDLCSCPTLVRLFSSAPSMPAYLLSSPRSLLDVSIPFRIRFTQHYHRRKSQFRPPHLFPSTPSMSCSLSAIVLITRRLHRKLQCFGFHCTSIIRIFRPFFISFACPNCNAYAICATFSTARRRQPTPNKPPLLPHLFPLLLGLLPHLTTPAPHLKLLTVSLTTVSTPSPRSVPQERPPGPSQNLSMKTISCQFLFQPSLTCILFW
ncbi:hypothetical protein BDP27DRAFT_1338327 [Rhodocollybia butyracea]|uniref:Uncharacterized protein n=1 Tax=Rhodocollybia butyracea TaxID=206335 RepID=A0A9P5U0H9_9AGAR|nr:hypothetical protein BDP27DRAFT_1338327 [Rhodocollybia butyracea]